MESSVVSRKTTAASAAVNIFCVIVIALGFLSVFSADWYIRVYGDMGFAAVIYTLTVNAGGVSSELVREYVRGSLLPAAACTLAVCLILLWQPRRQIVVTLWKKHRLRLYPFGKLLRCLAALVLSGILIRQAAVEVGLPQYIADLNDQSELYEMVYVDPAEVNILFPEEKKNLIYIFMESMETSFYSQEEGGGLPYNCIPELYQLAAEHVNFSNTADVGGFESANLTNWTIAAMVGQTAGLPLITPPGVGGNEYGINDEEFLPGATTLMDILHENGYYQTLMVGSDATFGGRAAYYAQHQVDRIYDLYTAREDGVIPEDYLVWWGFEDHYLYEYAKQELTEIAAAGQPFAFSMLTVDTHHIGGYICADCGSEHTEQYENVYSCASRQLTAFIDWLRQQDFWEDTVVVICGDHTSMDQGYIDRAMPADTQRLIYNCFINSAVQPLQSKNRIATTVDIFPTTLAALGCFVEGDRLAFGTNLFSGEQTQAEALGLEYFNTELGKNSDFYLLHMY